MLGDGAREAVTPTEPVGELLTRQHGEVDSATVTTLECVQCAPEPMELRLAENEKVDVTRGSERAGDPGTVQGRQFNAGLGFQELGQLGGEADDQP